MQVTAERRTVADCISIPEQVASAVSLLGCTCGGTQGESVCNAEGYLRRAGEMSCDGLKREAEREQGSEVTRDGLGL
jgi:hypothetical protein